jgi:hypothetical protein
MKTKRILVAEDDKDSLGLIRAALKSANCEWLEVTTKGEARDTFLRKSKNISAVVTSFIEPETGNENEFSDQWLARQDAFRPTLRLVKRDIRTQQHPFFGIGFVTLEKPTKMDLFRRAVKALLVNNVIPQDWLHLQKLLFKNSFNWEKNKHISPYVFRGLDWAGWCLTTKFTRLTSEDCSKSTASKDRQRKREDAIIRNFKKYAQIGASEQMNFWHWLSLGQHYGLATRLMDWTYSPLVALHFATNDKELRNKDGVVWTVNYRDAHGKGRVNESLPPRLQELLEKQEGDLFTVDTLSKGIKKKKGFEDLAEFDGQIEGPFVLFFEPPSFDQRIVNQFAVFSVASSRDLAIDEWLETSRVKCRRIIVPSHLKAEIREKLDQCNISERTLFPGLDGICSWLNRHYGPSWRLIGRIPNPNECRKRQ